MTSKITKILDLVASTNLVNPSDIPDMHAVKEHLGVEFRVRTRLTFKQMAPTRWVAYDAKNDDSQHVYLIKKLASGYEIVDTDGRKVSVTGMHINFYNTRDEIAGMSSGMDVGQLEELINNSDLDIEDSVFNDALYGVCESLVDGISDREISIPYETADWFELAGVDIIDTVISGIMKRIGEQDQQNMLDVLHMFDACGSKNIVTEFVNVLVGEIQLNQEGLDQLYEIHTAMMEILN